MSLLRSNQVDAFIDLPSGITPFLHWPTDNHHLHDDPARYFARTRANPDYGRPGFTRDCGRRFHRGCDIAPLHQELDGKNHRVMFSDCVRGTEYPSDEPGWIPHDRIYAVADGEVAERHDDDTSSTLGRYLIIRHHWPGRDQCFYSLYAHVNEILVDGNTTVVSGQPIGSMGQTSSSEDARTWMAIAPHLHLEFYDGQGRSFDPEKMLKSFVLV